MTATSPPRLVGMVHLPALPGSPAWDGTPIAALARLALSDAAVLQESGFDGLLVQNSLDRPTRERIDALAVAQLTAVTSQVIGQTSLSVGVNVVKNDGPAAVAIAAATGAAFVRVKALAGTILSAEGALHGCGYDTLQTRARSGERPAIWADVREPTSRPFPGSTLTAAVTDAMDFQSADAVIVTGKDTRETLELAEEVRAVNSDATLIIGGRIDETSIRGALDIADSVIIGSALKAVPGIRGRVDPDKASALANAASRATAHQ